MSSNKKQRLYELSCQISSLTNLEILLPLPVLSEEQVKSILENRDIVLEELIKLFEEINDGTD